MIFFQRLSISIVIGVALGLLLKFIGFEGLGYPQTIFATTFWVLAFMIVTFSGQKYHMLLWLLLLESSLSLYQASIFFAVRDEYVLLRIGPLLIAAVIFALTSRVKLMKSSKIYIFWILFNLPSVIPIFLDGHVNLNDGLLFWMFNIVYPLIYYFAISNLDRTEIIKHKLFDGITISLLIFCLIPLVFVPIEMFIRKTNGFSELQFGGGFYSVLGVLLLVFPIMMLHLSSLKPFMQYFVFVIIMLLFFLSFSRGIMLVFIFLLLGLLFLGGGQRSSVIKKIVFSSISILFFGWVFIPNMVIDIAWYWLVRMNIASNLNSYISFSTETFLQTSRMEIWDIAIKYFLEKPLIGYGIGATPELIKEATFQEFSFSGMHNLMLTVLVERGALGLIGLLMLFGRIIYLIIINKSLIVSRKLMGYLFIIFVLFANITGVELFLNSTRSLNVAITVYLFIIIGLFEYLYSIDVRKSKIEIDGGKTVNEYFFSKNYTMPS